MVAKLLTGHLFDIGGLPRVLLSAVLARWQLLTVLAVAVVLVCWVLARWVRGWRAAEAARAVWLGIEIPAPVIGDAGVFARRVAGTLHRTRGCGVRARHVVLEVHATTAGARMGVWVPPGVDPTAIDAAITDAWPGAVVTTTPVPKVPERRGVALEVTARNGVWAPWIAPRPATRQTAAGGDPLGGVLDRLSTRAGGECGFVQLVLGTYYRRPAVRGLATVVNAGLSEVMALLRFALFDVRTTPGARPAAPASPVAAARLEALYAKQAAAPHFSATLRIGVASAEPVPHGRAIVAGIAGGFDGIADSIHGGGLVTHRTRHRAYRVSARRPGRAFIATTAEVAALWHLPADAARYGLPVVHARTRNPRPGLPRFNPADPAPNRPAPDRDTPNGALPPAPGPKARPAGFGSAPGPGERPVLRLPPPDWPRRGRTARPHPRHNTTPPGTPERPRRSDIG